MDPEVGLWNPGGWIRRWVSGIPMIRKRISGSGWAEMSEAHTLPDGWEQMEYLDFLEKSRHLMAAIIRRGFETLT
jgi:hypothetical protein